MIQYRRYLVNNMVTFVAVTYNQYNSLMSIQDYIFLHFWGRTIISPNL